MILYPIATFYFLVNVVHCREFPIWYHCPIRQDDGRYNMTELNLTGHTRNDLKCAEVNNSNVNCTMFSNYICACTATAKWWLDGSKIGFLRLEYLSRLGDSVIMGTESTRDVEYDIYFLDESDSFLSFIPNNVCDYPEIVSMNLSNNRLIKLTNLSCITNLTLLDLSHNRIAKIEKWNFPNLSHLKDLDVSFNSITYIEPGTFNRLGLINLHVSNNNIKILDITHLLLSKTFCRVSFASNEICDFSNSGDDPVKGSDTFGKGGVVDLSNNDIKRLPNPASLEVGKGYHVYGKLYFNRFSFVLHNNPIACDCFLEELLGDVRSEVYRYEITESKKYVCHSPLRLRGIDIIKEVIGSPRYLSVLTCNLTHACPHHCSCYFESSINAIVVDCTKSHNDSCLPKFDLTKMTKGLRNHTKYENVTIHLRFSHRNIEKLDDRDYLINTSFIDLSYNNVKDISESAMQKLTSSFAEKLTLNLTSNSGELKLPSSLRYLKPQNVYLNNVTLQCNCDLMSWFPKWLETNTVEKAGYNITCSIKQQLIPFENVTISDLDCEKVDLHFLAYTLGVLLMTIIIGYFLFDKYGLYGFVYYKSIIVNKRKMQEWFKYDVYISCEETNEALFRYVVREFIPMLKAFQLKPFLLAQDSEFGEVLEESIINNLDASRIYVFFLSSTVSFVGEDNSTFWKEWKHAWNKYAFSTVHDIVLVNFDLLRLSNLKDKRIRTTLAIGNQVKFSDVDFKRKIIKLLNKRSGQLPHIWDRNFKSKFDLSSLNEGIR